MATKQNAFLTWVRDNSLSIVLLGLFLLFLGGLVATGYIHENQELESHAQASVSLLNYITSGSFVEAVFENWESEFLQMGALVVLTIFLYQKGSADSKKTRSKSHTTHSRSSIIRGFHAAHKGNGAASWLYTNSLTIALFSLFILSFLLHAAGGVAAYNTEAAMHHEQTISFWGYLTSATFWFESFQNWQSEFLAVAALLLLSIYLRQKGSPESKYPSDPDSKTGS